MSRNSIDQEIGWLIERCLGGPALWWDGHGKDTFSGINHAVRFARREDAQIVLEHIIDGFDRQHCVVTEHIWVKGEADR